MKYSLIYLFSIINVLAFGQWNLQNSGVSSKLLTIENYGTFQVVGGANVILKSTNQGLNWNSITPKMPNNQTITGGFESINYFDQNNGLMAGSFFLSNDEIIFNTSNGGSIWNTSYLNNVGTWPRDVSDLDFVNATDGFAVTSTGRILASNDAGLTWGLIAQIGYEEFYAAFFKNISEGVIVGENGIWRTSDSGVSWAHVLNLPIANFSSVHFPSSQIGYAVGENVIYKTTDGGITWFDLSSSIPTYETYNSVFFTSDLAGYVAAETGLFRTQDGGNYWEFKSFTQSINDVVMSDFNNGFLCGDNGKIYSTSNGGGNYAPVANFFTEPSICVDSLIMFANLSDPSNSFEWWVDGVMVSTTYNFDTIFTTSFLNHDVMLVVTNAANLSSSITNNIYIPESPAINMNATIANDSLCYMQNTNVTVNSATWGTNYWLENSSHTRITSYQMGNGTGNLVFNTGSYTQAGNYYLLGSKEVSGCGIYYDTLVLPLYYMTPSVVLSSIMEDTICSGDSTLVIIPNSEWNVGYYLLSSSFISDTVYGNSASIQVNTGGLDTTSILTLMASGVTGCPANLGDVTVEVDIPSPFFNANLQMIEANELLTCLNTNVQNNYSYVWDFDGASVTSSGLIQPNPISYTAPGTYEIVLHANSILGCSDSLIQTVEVISSIANNPCSYIELLDSGSQNSSQIKSLAYGDDNSFVVFHSASNNHRFLTVRQGLDSLDWNYIPDGFGKNHLLKYNDKGLLEWKAIIGNSSGLSSTDVTIDDENSTYVAYRIDDFMAHLVKIVSSDGSVSYYDAPPTGSSGLYAFVISKFDSTGVHLWSNSFNSNVFESVNLEVDEDHNVYTAAGNRIVKFDEQGSMLWLENTGYSLANLTLKGDSIFIIEYNGLTYQIRDSNGQLLSRKITDITGALAVSEKILLDDNSNIYVMGKYSNYLTFANQQYSAPNGPGSTDSDIFIAKFKPDGSEDWFRTVSCDNPSRTAGFSYENGRLYMAATTWMETISTFGLPDISISNFGYYIFSCDTSNINANWELISNAGQVSGLANDDFKSVNSKLLFGFEYLDDQTLMGDLLENNTDTYVNNDVVVHAKASCLLPAIDSLVPSPYFYASSVCVNTPLDLNGVATQNPTSWTWTAPGGSISSTTTAQTTVTYSTPGTYYVGLNATNAFGISQPYSRTILVTEIPQVTFAVPEVCEYATNAPITLSGASEYIWYDQLNTNSRNLILNGGQTTFNFTAYNAPNCSLDTSVTVSLLPAPNIVLIENPGSGHCVGETYDLSVTGADYYYWQDFDVEDSVLVEYISNPSSLEIYAENNNGCYVNTEVFPDVNYYPFMGISHSPYYPCYGDTVLVYPGFGSADSYLWNTGSTNDTISFIITQDSAFSLTAASANGYCVKNYNYSISVADVPNMEVTVNPTGIVCEGSPLTIGVTPQSNVLPQWDMNGTTFTSNFISTFATTDLNIFIHFENSLSGCYQDTSFVVSVEPGGANISYSSSPQLCVGDSLLLTSDSLTNNTWSLNSNFLSTQQSIYAFTSGYYVLERPGACNAKDSVMVTFTPKPVAIITPNSDTVLCPNATLELSSSLASGIYWLHDQVTFSSSQNVTVTDEGTFQLFAVDGGCWSDSVSIEVTHFNVSSPSISANGANQICMGEELELSSNLSTNNLWSLNGSYLSNLPTLMADQTGYYVLTSDTVCALQDSFYVYVRTLPIASITANNGTILCEGESTTLSSVFANGYSWSLNNTFLSSQSNVSASVDGVYGLTVYDLNCTSDTSFVTISHYPDQTPVIVSSGTTLSISGNYTGIQWYLDGLIIPGATSINYTAIENGDYTVFVIDDNGCSYTSTAFLISSIHIDEMDLNVQFYPNPFFDNALLEISSVPVDGYTVEIFDNVGKVIEKYEMLSNQLVIKNRNMGSGNYQLVVYSKQAVVYRKMITVF